MTLMDPSHKERQFSHMKEVSILKVRRDVTNLYVKSVKEIDACCKMMS